MEESATLVNNNPQPNHDSVPMITDEKPTPNKTIQRLNAIKKSILTSFRSHGFTAKLSSVRKRVPIENKRAKYHSYNHCMFELKKKRRVAVKESVQYGFYAASSKHERDAFLSYCFGILVNHQFASVPFPFYPMFKSRPSEILSVAADEDGVSRLLLCSILLGKVELVSPYSGQCGPSSEEFDSGVDDLVSPTKYFVWNVHAVLPLYVFGFRPRDKVMIGRGMSSSSARTEPGLGALITKDILKFIPADARETLEKHHLEYKNKKIKTPEMIRRMRSIVGDELWNRFITPEMEKKVFTLEKVFKMGKKHKPVKQKEDMLEQMMDQFSGGFNISTATNS